MGMLKLSFYDFVCWTTKGVILERVTCTKSYITDHAPHCMIVLVLVLVLVLILT